MLYHALKALRANFTRTVLIFLSLSVSITAVFLITAIAHGIVDSYSTILKSDGDLIITQAKISDTFFSNVDTALIPKIKKIKGVQSVEAMIVGASPVEALPIVAVYGLSKGKMKSYKIVAGEYPKDGEVMLGKTIASRVQKRYISIGDKEYRVSGVYESDTGFESGGVILTLKDAGELFNKKSSMLFVNVAKNSDIDKIIQKIKSLSKSIDVKTTDSFVKNYNQFKIITTSADAISLIALLMGLISIASIMSVTILERKYEFGILRALGFSRMTITLRILVETLIIWIVGFFTALGVSVGILWILKKAPQLQGYIDGVITLPLALEVAVASLVMTILGALIPAIKASGIDPVELINRGSRA